MKKKALKTKLKKVEKELVKTKSKLAGVKTKLKTERRSVSGETSGPKSEAVDKAHDQPEGAKNDAAAADSPSPRTRTSPGRSQVAAKKPAR